MKAILLTLVGLSLVSSLHLELSNKFIGNLLEKEKDVFSGLINKEWEKYGVQQSVSLDFGSLKTQNAKDTTRDAVDFTF